MVQGLDGLRLVLVVRVVLLNLFQDSRLIQSPLLNCVYVMHHLIQGMTPLV